MDQILAKWIKKINIYIETRTTRTIMMRSQHNNFKGFLVCFWHERVAFQRSSFGRRRSGGSLLAMTQWPLKTPFFSFSFFSFFSFFSVVYFSHRRSAWIKKLIQRKLTGAPQNLGVDPFPDPVGHFGAPWRPFWIFEVLIEGMVE